MTTVASNALNAYYEWSGLLIRDLSKRRANECCNISFYHLVFHFNLLLIQEAPLCLLDTIK